MGQQSIIQPSRLLTVLLWMAILLLMLSTSRAHSQTQATALPLILPSAIAYDSAGNLYIAETGNHDIRKVDATGNITAIAGTGTQGFSGDNGPATAALLDSPQGLALDGNNNLYIADTHNNRIRKLNLTTGIITTIAGTTAGFSGDNNPATTANLNLPTALAIDANNNLYIADTENHRIRKITASTGMITTVAGNGIQGFSGDNGLAITASIDSPTGMTVDTAGNLYLSDTHNHRIRKVDAATGIITTIAGTGSPGFSGDASPAIAASLALPHGLSLDSIGNLYIADTENHRIRRIDATTGVITTVAGSGTQTFSGDNGPAIAATLDSPRTTILSPTGLVTFTDTANQRIRQLDAEPTPGITTIAGLSSTTGDTLTITTLNASAPSIPSGTPLTLITHTASTTSGAPTGSVSLVEGATRLLSAAVSASGDASFTTNTLTPGLHTLTTLYAGDRNFISSTSTSALITVIATPSNLSDFTLTPAGSTTQTIPSGGAASFNFTIQIQGNTLASPISLAATGLPAFATASFNPAYLPPGTTPNAFTLTINTPQTTALRTSSGTNAPLLALLLFPITGIALRSRNPRKTTTYATIAILTGALILCSGCGSRINTGTQSTNPLTTHTITVTGTATSPTGSILQLLIQSVSNSAG